MATQNNNIYKIKIENRHLKNILEENYYIELGTISIKKMNRFLKNQLFDIAELCYYDLAVEGVGKITDDRENDLEFQMMYLLHMRQKSSSNKIFLTCNVLKYYDLKGREVFAPIVLIPVDIDGKDGKIIKTGMPIINNVLISELQVIKKEAININGRLSTLEHINNVTIDLVKKTGYEFRIGNYLTFAAIDYQDKMLDVDENFFDTQRSIHELTAAQIRKSFYHNIKAVVPTSIIQKFVLLKASNNENFIVLGRFGSGKTYTCLNIVADKVAKGKKVLYVNQDIDNIIDFQKSLNFLQLGKYVFNFCEFSKESQENATSTLVIPKIENEEMNNDILDEIEEFENVFNLRLHGFRYQTIVNQLAIIKNSESTLLPIKIEPILQNNEVGDIYNWLLEIEQDLATITPLKDNVWMALENFYTINNVSEITTALTVYREEQWRLNQLIRQFTLKYQLAIPDNARDFHRLLNIFRCFMLNNPPLSWVDDNMYGQAITANEKLLKTKIRISELEKEYQRLLDKSYQIGTATEVINALKRSKTLKQDEITYNKVLAFEGGLSYQLPQIEYHYDLFTSKHKKIYNYFGLSEHDDVFYKYGKEIEELLAINAINKNWFNLYLRSQRQYLANNEIILEDISQITHLAKTIQDYLLSDQPLKYASIKAHYQSSRFYQLILGTLDLKKIKSDKKTPEEITRLLFDYGNDINQLIEKLDGFGIYYFDDIEEFMSVYRIWATYARKMSIPQQKLIERLVRNIKHNKVNVAREYYQNIADFNYEHQVIEEIIDNFGRLGIVIEGTTVLIKARNCLLQVAFLKNLALLRNEFRRKYQSNELLTYADLQSVQALDNEYMLQQATLKEDDKYYRELLGTAYKGINTDCNEMYALIFSFKQFKERIVSPQKDYLKDLMMSEKMKNLLDEYKIINAQYERFYEAHRQFGRYFVGGVTHLLECSLTEAYDSLQNFNQHLNELPQVVKIITKLNYLRKRGLYDLADGIKNSRYCHHLAVSYMYVTLSTYYQQAKEEYPILKREETALEWLENYNLFERDYCTTNINHLLKETEHSERRLQNRLNNVIFNNYNQVILQEEKHRQIYLASIDIFNSDLDLSLFDTVIIDDCHLGSANKYHRIFECRHVIAFGDASFKYNQTTSLMNKFARKNKIYYTKRYLKLSSRFGNEWQVKDEYIYLFQPKIDIVDVDSFTGFTKYLYHYFMKDQKAVINVVVLSHSVKRLIFMEVIAKLRNDFTADEIKIIMTEHLRVVFANSEAPGSATDVIYFYDDLRALEGERLKNAYRNYSSVANRINIVYTKRNKTSAELADVKKTISNIIGRLTVYQKENSGIINIVIEALARKGIEASPGFGRFDVVIHNQKTDANIGIIIEGNQNIMPYSLIDDYQYYYGQYTKHGWQVFIFYIEDLINHLDQKIMEIELALTKTKYTLK